METNNKKQELEHDFKVALSGFFEALTEFKEACDIFETKGKKLKAQIHEEDAKEIQKFIGKTISRGWAVKRIDAINLYEDTFEDLLLPQKYLYVEVKTTDIVNGSTYSIQFVKEDLIELLNGGEAKGYTLLKDEDVDEHLKKIKEAKEQEAERLRPIKAKRQRLYDFVKELLVGKTIADHGIVGFEAPEKPRYDGETCPKYDIIERTIEDVIETEGPPCWSDLGSPDGKQVTIKCTNGVVYNLKTMGFQETLIGLLIGKSIEMDHFTHRFWIKEYKLCPLICNLHNGYDWYGMDSDDFIENTKIVINQSGIKL